MQFWLSLVYKPLKAFIGKVKLAKRIPTSRDLSEEHTVT